MIGGRVSVVIPAYNYGRYLNEAVASVYRQTYQDWELVIVDDGSSDDTSVVGTAIAARDPARVKFFRIENGGVSAARNFAIRQGQGEFIMPLDADDLLMPTALAEFVQALQTNPRAGYAFSNLENLNALSGDLRIWEQGPFIRGRIVLENTAASASMWRRSLFEQGVHYRPMIFEDWDLWLQIVACGFEGAYVPEPLFQYRLHVSGRTARNRYLYFPALLEIMRANPTLYDPQLVRWAASCLAFSPECWKKSTVVFLPLPGSQEFSSFTGPMAAFAKEFLARRHFVAALGEYPAGMVSDPGLALLTLTQQDFDAIAHKLGMLGSSLLVFSQLPDWMNAGIRALKNVATVHRFDSVPALTASAADALLADAECQSNLKRSAENEFWSTMKQLDDEYSAGGESDQSVTRHSILRGRGAQDSGEQGDSTHEYCTVVVPVKDPVLSQLDRCLESIRTANEDISIVVSDFGSADTAIRGALPALCEQHRATLLSHQTVAPFSQARAFNAAAAKLSCRWLLLLPPSAIVSPEFFEHFSRYQHEAGADAIFVGEAKYLPPLTAQELRRPFAELSQLARFRSEVTHNFHFLSREWLSEIGGLSEKFVGSGYETAEIEWRAQLHGKRVVWLPRGAVLRMWDLHLGSVREAAQNDELLKRLKQHPRHAVRSWGVITDEERQQWAQRGPVAEVLPACFAPAAAIAADLHGTPAAPQGRISLLIAWGMHCLANDEQLSARQAFEDVLTIDARNVDALLGLGYCAAKRGAAASMGHYAAAVLKLSSSHPQASEMMNYLRKSA